MANKETVEKVKSLLEGHCYGPLKEAAEDWLDKLDTEAEKLAEEKLKPMLKEGVATVNEMIELFGSEEGRAKFGGELADKIKGHAEELKEAGEKFCDCDACKKARSILEDLGEKLEDALDL